MNGCFDGVKKLSEVDKFYSGWEGVIIKDKNNLWLGIKYLFYIGFGWVSYF